MEERKVMLNQPMFDWLTLTTYEAAVAARMEYVVFHGDAHEEKRLQYHGFGHQGAFLGLARQRGRDHWMFQASGEWADTVTAGWAHVFTPYDWNVTRCDLQVTIPCPPHYSSRELYDDIDAWDGPGRKRQVSIVQSGDGLDTVYIGNRASDRFIRIYVKPIDGGLKALRFEVEYKADHAHRVLHDCLKEPRNKSRILYHEVGALPKNQVTMPFLRVLGSEAHKPKIERVTGQNSTLDWLRETVTPSLERLANDHEVGDEVKRLVRLWHQRFCSPFDQ